MGGAGNNHRKVRRKLGRTSAHRTALLRTMVDQLIQCGRIKTTEAKAKELRRVADWMVMLGRQGDDIARVRAKAYLRTDKAENTLFNILVRNVWTARSGRGCGRDDRVFFVSAGGIEGN
jgi:large subunit ribosomal protein L17